MNKKELFRIMAAADSSMLRELAQPLAAKYGVSIVKEPAKTLAMIKLREPVQNSLFYLGEALVCDIVVELGGTKGTAVVLGDDFDKVSAMAVIDAAFNKKVAETAELTTVLERLAARRQKELELENGLYAKTIVDFQSMDQESAL
ncbi:phosphonate C-P lyase system protein PhnG [uncultured Phascolarctobacterium sp.]|uniref:phosphonate C-P lyase system protein PhnG n=1 Tax=uncultured Phascolarctobacterium sp. TaxID=512296 RepID=UPI0027D98F03|nr:phosphonate C-P lyase system protein PhnG [uncultured Phascolarctobacterium sp.]